MFLTINRQTDLEVTIAYAFFAPPLYIYSYTNVPKTKITCWGQIRQTRYFLCHFNALS